VRALAADPGVAEVHAFSRNAGSSESKVYHHRCNTTDQDSIESAFRSVGGPFHVVLNATGLLHGDGLKPEKSWQHLDAEQMAQIFQVNTIGPVLVAKAALPLLAKDEKAVFAAISARVGSIGDNRLGGWLTYRASKAALNQALKTLSIELRRKHPEAICVGLHPGTVDTGLSKPFQGGVPEGKLFTPEYSAGSMLDVIDKLNAQSSGKCFAYDGSEIPP